MKKLAGKNESGFTLIEFIAALVIGAIAAAMVYSYFNTSLSGSAEPVKRLQEANNLRLVMENIVADYNRLNNLNNRSEWKASQSYRLNSVVVPTTSNGHFYSCTAAGTSGATAPAWPTGTNGTVTDGTVTWKEGGVIWNATGTTETIVWQPAHAYSQNNIMIPSINNGHYYKCITAAGGTSGSTVPKTWKYSYNFLINDIIFALNGRFYRCIVAGKSGTTEPAWPASDGTTITDNTVTWQEVPDGSVRWAEAGTILYSPDTTNTVLKDNLYNYLTTIPGRYGNNYTVVAADTKFIKFSGSTEAAVTGGDEKNILKVTIKDDNSVKTLTQIFTIR